NLNIEEQMKLQMSCYGAYSQEIEDYTKMRLQEQLATKSGRELTNTVDPWSYRSRLTIPKLIINGTNDPYWVISSLNIYWDGLKGNKSIVYVPNAGHDLGIRPSSIDNMTRVIAPVAAFV